MKRILIKLSQAILLCIVLVFSSCENEEFTAGISVTSISVAKNWYEGFNAKENFQPIFKDLIYNWHGAAIIRLTDGTEAITVPVVYPNESQDYYGRKIMYLYTKNQGADYDVAVFEFIPNPKKVQTRQEIIDLTAFDGYIIHWDLVQGFVRGSKFEENLTVNDIGLKVEYANKDASVFRQAEGDPWEIALREIIIVKDSKTDNGSDGGRGFNYTIRNYSNVGDGTTASNYANGGGAAGGNSNSLTSFVLDLDLLTEKVDPKEQVKCFDKTLGAKLTVYVQQPNENSNAIIGENSVGHAFIGIEQNGIVRQLGFYPTQSSNSALVAVGTAYPSEIRGNYNYLYHVSISKNISPTELNSIINYIENYPKTYNVNSYACADFAIAVGIIGGIPLKSTTVSSLTFSGRSPGRLGQEIRSMNSTSSITVNKSSAKSPITKGDCK